MHVRIRSTLMAAAWLTGAAIPVAAQDAPAPAPASATEADDEFLRLGTPEGLGGADWSRYERSRTKDLLRSFIPPLLRPAFVEHAFVLPPNAIAVSVAGRQAHIDGHDFFAKSEVNSQVFRDFEVDRQFLDVDLFYGFDLGVKYLHNFTVRLHLPFEVSRTDGFIHPNGFQLVNLHTRGDTADLGDVGLFLKKKFVDQAEWPVQIAGVMGVRFPTGSHARRFGDDGRIVMQRPDPTMGAGQPGRPPLDMPMPLAMLAGAPQATTPFIFNCPAGRLDPSCGTLGQPGQFWRFADDGRLPTVLQPGTGTFSVMGGLFLTRVNPDTSWLGRSAFHAGALYTARFARGGIDPGDQLVAFASFMKPLLADFLTLDVAYVSFWQEQDHYGGTIYAPTPTDAAGEPVAGWSEATHVTFREEHREPFVEGYTAFVAPGLVISLDPSVRLSVSVLLRVISPKLGPAPKAVFRWGIDVTF